MPDCPTCGSTLSTKQGMRQHHPKVHSESLPNRTCAECGDQFYDPKARRTYCDDCYTGAGKQNGNWKNVKETTNCRNCGSEFEYYPSNKDGVFCSACVEKSDEFLGTPSYELRDVPRVNCRCDQCGKSFEVLRSAIDRDSRRGRFALTSAARSGFRRTGSERTTTCG